MSIKNTLIKTLLISLIFFVSCDENDDDETVLSNKFTTANLDFATPNCYIEFDEDDQDQFNLFFLDGRMYDNDTNVNSSSGDYLFSLNTNNFVFYNLEAIDNPTIVMPSYPNIQTGVAYIGSDSDSVIAHGFSVDALSPNFSFNGFDFGMPDETTGVIHQPMPGNTKTITINAYNYDSSTQSGTINVDYNFLDAGGNAIVGHYEGTLGVILD